MKATTEVFEIKKSRLERQITSPPQNYRRSNVGYFVTIAGIVLVTSAVLIVLHFTMESDVAITEQIEVLHRSTAEQLEGEEQCDDVPFCDSRDCVATASRILKLANFEADPCVDFYDYACGGYSRMKSIPYGFISYSPTTEAQYETIIDIRRCMDKLALENEDTVLQKVRTFYESCDNITKRSEQQNTSLVFWLNDNGLVADGFTMGDELNFDNMVPWSRLVSRLEEYQIHTIFKPTFIEAENSAPEKMEIDCVVPYLTPEAYLNTSNVALKFQRTLYKEAMVATLKQMFMGKQEIKQFVEDVMAIERDIAEAINITERRADMEEEHKQQVKEIWRSVIGDAIQDMEIVSVCKYDMSSILTVLNGAPQRNVLKYVIWRMFAELMQYLGTDFRSIHLHYLTRLPRVEYAYVTMWQECADVIRNDLGLAATKMLFDNRFLKTNDIEELNKIFRNLKVDFTQLVEGADGLSEEIRERIADKLKAMKLETGYTDIIHQEGALETLYRNLEFTDNYFLNVVNLKRFKARHHLTRLWYANSDDPHRFPNYYGRNQSDMWLPVSVVIESMIWTSLARNTKSALSLERSPLGLKAEYDYNDNIVRIDLGLLRPPLFRVSTTVPKYALYGYYALIAKEMTKAFDETGIRYNARGERTENGLWSDSGNGQQSGFLECLKHKEIGGKNVNNTEKINDIISDIGSFDASFEGAKRHLHIEEDDEKPLPGITLNKKQTFFVVAAQRFCELISDPSFSPEARMKLPAKDRLNNALSNMIEFGGAFHCPLRTAMNPYLKCTVF